MDPSPWRQLRTGFASSYRAWSADKLTPHAGTPFDVIADISEFEVQKPEVNAQIQETMRFAASCGMQRAANVVSSTMTKFQIQRLSEESGVPLFSFFTSVQEAVKALRP